MVIERAEGIGATTKLETDMMKMLGSIATVVGFSADGVPVVIATGKPMMGIDEAFAEVLPRVLAGIRGLS